MAEFDVIVVGGGIGSGLSCAAYLQKSGLDVCVIEERNELGTYDPTTEYRPNVINSPHASINFSGSSPIIEDLNLPAYGYEIYASPVVHMETHKDGKCCGFFYHQDETAKSFAKFSEKDAEKIRDIESRLLKVRSEYSRLVDFTPYPHEPDSLDEMMEMSVMIWGNGYEVEDFKEMNGFELVEETFESDYTRRTLLTLPSLNLKGDPCARGQGAFLIPMSMTYFSGQAKGGNHSLVHAVYRVFTDHGGTTIRNSRVDDIIVKDGEAKGVVLGDDAAYPQKTIRAKKAVVSAVGAKESLRLIGEDPIKEIDPKLWSKMKNWKTTERASTCSHWVLNSQPNWKSKDFDDRIKKAHLLYRAWDSWEHCKEWNATDMKNQNFDEAYDGLCEILNFSAIDPSQISPEGRSALRAEVAVPWHGPERRVLRENDPGLWDEFKDDLRERRNQTFSDLIDEFEDQVEEEIYMTPIDLWRYNRASPYGQVVGGDFSEDQWVMSRLPYRSSIENLYFALGTWPLTLSWCANGINAAEIVARDLGIRWAQKWWHAEPWEWAITHVQDVFKYGV